MWYGWSRLRSRAIEGFLAKTSEPRQGEILNMDRALGQQTRILTLLEPDAGDSGASK